MRECKLLQILEKNHQRLSLAGFLSSLGAGFFSDMEWYTLTPHYELPSLVSSCSDSYYFGLFSSRCEIFAKKHSECLSGAQKPSECLSRIKRDNTGLPSAQHEIRNGS